jgi:chromosomal replication initiator protein
VVTGVFSIPLRPREFIVGSENRLLELAILLLRNGAEADASPQKMFANPLVLWGGAGAGKTHLARGIAETWLGVGARDQGSGVRGQEAGCAAPVVQLNTESLRKALADNRQPSRLAAWRRRVRGAELLVFEDVHNLAGHDSAQHELADTIDALLADGGRVLVTSRIAPAALTSLDARLRSRLEAGLVVQIALPQRATRLALLETAVRDRRLPLDGPARAALADAQQGTAGELLAALERLAAHQGETSLTPAAVRQLAGPERPLRKLRIATVAARVARRSRVAVDELRGRSRRRTVATARAMTMYLCRHVGGCQLRQIGEYLGGRDRTTVLHGCQTIAEQLQHDPVTQAEVTQLKKALK